MMIDDLQQRTHEAAEFAYCLATNSRRPGGEIVALIEERFAAAIRAAVEMRLLSDFTAAALAEGELPISAGGPPFRNLTPAPTWTTTPPIVSGWYWWRRNSTHAPKAVHVEIRYGHPVCDDAQIGILRTDEWWPIPIEVPI